ncbi:5-formyltetrahydrofolate cyclo-ligase [Pseudodesulfovibrio sp. JC047]|uniref:5-formyltetrahydrofolate cyclo-ligase n=1 Tax=Pseudodesulfovibrio sp. JC047 TaxID=2683199 RepID=UPI0013D1DF6F|nr:5-formyltetrahydrofolate cyclo-ligase [Pseudodesulfovibrio sp. JC047]NDV20284.1 5-formyltetrahydrofolate cyclo-ligase [Pseudodesulfovibrio sp. JC047]
MTDMDKQQLRTALRKRRAALSPSWGQNRSHAAGEHVRSLDIWHSAKEVLLYWPVREELDVRPLVKELWDRSCRVLMPRCRPDEYGHMDIACASCEDDLIPGAFSILEPDAKRCPPVASCTPDLAIIPAVCFDRHGYRLGYGGGYYDRLLAGDAMRDTVKVGVGYAFQLIDALPVQPWDIPVDIICTDEEIWRP